MGPYQMSNLSIDPLQTSGGGTNDELLHHLSRPQKREVLMSQREICPDFRSIHGIWLCFPKVKIIKRYLRKFMENKIKR